RPAPRRAKPRPLPGWLRGHVSPKYRYAKSGPVPGPGPRRRGEGSCDQHCRGRRGVADLRRGGRGGAAGGARGGRGAGAGAPAGRQLARDVATRQPVYGRNTGVGANHVVELGEGDRAEHGVRLLRSHAAGTGPLLAPEVARAMLVVRLNQLGAGGSGVGPAPLPVLAAAINRGVTPPGPLYGAIGTGALPAPPSTA